MTDTARSELPAEFPAPPAPPLPHACPRCGDICRPDVLRLRCFVCDCGHHHRMPAATWAALLADPGTWHERWSDLAGRDWLGWSAPTPYGEVLAAARRSGRDASRKVAAAGQLRLTAPDLLRLGLIDAIVSEPAGGAQADRDGAARCVEAAAAATFDELGAMSAGDLVRARLRRFRYIDRRACGDVLPPEP